MKAVLLSLLFIICFITGCATVPQPSIYKPQVLPGIYHHVKKGETLWKISKSYNIELDELAKINRISDATNIEIGQLIFIPHAKRQQVSSGVSLGEDFIWPIKGRVIATFNQTFDNMINKGINIEPYSDAEVLVSRSGKVVFYSPNLRSFGKTIIIDHGDGFLTVYARSSEVFIKVGDQVRKGTVIAKINSTSKDTNAYLHFEIRKGHISQNPYFYLP